MEESRPEWLEMAGAEEAVVVGGKMDAGFSVVAGSGEEGWFWTTRVSSGRAKAARAARTASWKTAANSAPVAAVYGARGAPFSRGWGRSKSAASGAALLAARGAAPAVSAPSARCRSAPP